MLLSAEVPMVRLERLFRSRGWVPLAVAPGPDEEGVGVALRSRSILSISMSLVSSRISDKSEGAGDEGTEGIVFLKS